MTDTLYFALLGSTALFLLVFIFIRDAKFERRFRSYERAIDILNRKNYELDKELKETTNSTQFNQKVANAVNEELGQFTQSLIKGLKDIQENNKKFQLSTDERIEKIESKIKEYFTMPSTNPMKDEGSVLRLYKEGYNLDEIAKELRMTVGEIEFILRLNQLKN